MCMAGWVFVKSLSTAIVVCFFRRSARIAGPMVDWQAGTVAVGTDNAKRTESCSHGSWLELRLTGIETKTGWVDQLAE